MLARLAATLRAGRAELAAVVLAAAGIGALAPSVAPYRAGATAQETSRVVTIIYTGDTRGWVEPCGCSQGVLGGLPRRATLLRRLREQTPKAPIVDAGALLGESSDELKVPLIVEQLKAMGYGAANLGSADAGWRKTVASLMRKQGLAGVSLQYADGEAIRSHRVVESGATRVGVAGVARFPAGKQRQALKKALAELRRAADLVVLLSAAGAKDNLRLAREVGGMDVIIGRAPGKRPQLLRAGKIWLAPVTPEGGHVGRLTLRLGNAGAVEAALDLYALGDQIPDDAATMQAVQAYYDRVAKELLTAPGSAMVEAGYTFASSCDFCHPRIYRKWRAVAHSRALATLNQKGRGLTPDCLQCHSEYYRRTKKAPTAKEHQGGVECASCHGEGFVLILRPSKRMDAAKPGEKVCRGCHTPQRSPKFNFKRYKAKIKHW